jgi:hypothetical protein
MNPRLSENDVDRLKRLRLLILERFESQANFAVATGQYEPFVSAVLNGRKFLRDDQREIWAVALRCDYSLFLEAPKTFKKNNEKFPVFSAGE